MCHRVGSDRRGPRGRRPARRRCARVPDGRAGHVATLGSVYRTLGRRALAVYLGTIVVGSVGLAYAFDALVPLSITAPHEHAHEASLIAMASAGLLLGMLVWFASEDVRAWQNHSKAPAASPSSLTVGVDGMTCQGCVRKLTRTLGEDDRIESATVELDPGSATVQGSLDADAVAELVRKAGFTPRP